MKKLNWQKIRSVTGEQVWKVTSLGYKPAADPEGFKLSFIEADADGDIVFSTDSLMRFGFGTCAVGNGFPSFWALTDTDGHSLWSSIQKECPPREPDYSSIEQLFCLPVAENKDKNVSAPVKKVSKEVSEVNTCLEKKKAADCLSSSINQPLQRLSRLRSLTLRKA